MNVLRYCNLDESLQGEDGLVCESALERLYNTKELDYMSYIVLRMFENTEVSNLVSRVTATCFISNFVGVYILRTSVIRLIYIYWLNMAE